MSVTLSSTPPSTISSTDFSGISTLREDEALNQCFKADVSFVVDGEAESLSYIALEEASSYEYTKSDKYTGSAHLEVLMAANLALKSSVSYKDFKAVSGNSYSTTIGAVHKLPISFIKPNFK